MAADGSGTKPPWEENYATDAAAAPHASQNIAPWEQTYDVEAVAPAATETTAGTARDEAALAGEPATPSVPESARAVPAKAADQVASAESSKAPVEPETTASAADSQATDVERAISPIADTAAQKQIFDAKPGERTQGGTLVSTHTRLKDATAAATSNDNHRVVPWTDKAGKSRWSVVDTGSPVLGTWKRKGRDGRVASSPTGRYQAEAVVGRDGTASVRVRDTQTGRATVTHGAKDEKYPAVAARALKQLSEPAQASALPAAAAGGETTASTGAEHTTDAGAQPELHDLAELLGIPPHAISLNGELGLAFGARGKGLTGARAHYERDRVVMNLTKMQGAGALAHEWFHALDHYLGREGGTTSKEWRTLPDGTRELKATGDATRDMASYSAARADALRAELRDAYVKLIDTMQRTATTFVRDTAKIERFTGHARQELEGQLKRLRDFLATKQAYGARGKREPASAEQLAEFDAIATKLVHGDGLALRQEANKPAPGRKFAASYRRTNDDLERLSAILKAVRGRGGFSSTGRGWMNDIAGSMQRYRVRLAEAADAKVNPEAASTKPTSFRMEAIKADQGRGTDYWSTRHEMAARAFSAYVEDKLAADGRASDFLSFGSDGRFALPIPELPHPFPQGEERAAIGRAFDTFFKTVKAREDEAGNVAMFSQPARDARGRGLARDQTQKLVDGVTAKWGDNQPRVRVLADAEGLPASAKEDAGYKTAEGYYDPATRTAYLVASNLKSPQRALQVLAHEAIGHHGVENVVDMAFGEGAWKKVADAIARLDTSGRASGRMRDVLQETHRRYSGADPLTFAREFLAVSAEKGVRNTFTDRVVAAFRKFLRQVMPNLKISERELRGLLAQGDRFVRDAAPYRERVAQKAALAFSRTDDQTQTDAFRKFFGDSKVVTADGKPRPVFHGTSEGFYTFDNKRLSVGHEHSEDWGAAKQRIRNHLA